MAEKLKSLKLHDEWIIKEVMKRAKAQNIPAYIVVEDLLSMNLETPEKFTKEKLGYSFMIDNHVAMDFVKALYYSKYTVTISQFNDETSIITIGKERKGNK